MKTRILTYILIAFMAITLSCSEDMLQPAVISGVKQELRIEATFMPMPADSPFTKAAPESSPASIRTWGYRWSVGDTQGAPSWFTDRTFTIVGTSYVYDGYIEADVPAGYEASVWGIAPGDATGLSGLPQSSIAATPGFTYITPGDVSLQRDIQTGTSSVISAGTTGPVKMSFEHVMAGLRFHTATNYVPSYLIRSISISGIADAGIYTQGQGWSGISGSVTYTITPEVTPGRTDYNTLLGTEDMTMMLIPQTLPMDASLSVTIDRGSGDETLSASLAGLELQQGYIMSIRIGLPEEESVDLSYRTYTGAESVSRNTANCYIVRAAGVYDLPLVYGNGIKAGMINSASYTRLVSDYTAEFVNHLGSIITSPYIEENTGCTAGAAGLLWQTSPDVVKSVRIVEGSPCRMMRIHIDRIPETNALAVVYVKDMLEDIMWSWMLWVTADDIHAEALTNANDIIYYIMNENLGAIWSGPGRDITDDNRYVSPHYQWGRKDPMCPATAYNNGSNMTLYDIDGAIYTGYGSYGVDADSDAGGTERSIANSIRMPEKLFRRHNSTNHNWNNLPWFNNYWNAAETESGNYSNNQETAIKTIYDPCPNGWMLPAGKAFTGLSSSSVLNSMTGGKVYKLNSHDEIGTWFQFLGKRGPGGGFDNVGSASYYTFAVTDSRYVRSLSITSAGSVTPNNNDYRSTACVVRPVLEP